jgi:hypothetical protein
MQDKYVENLLIKFSMNDSKPVGTPMETGFDLYSPKEARKEERPYRQLIGSLVHLANYTRPDISHAVGVLSRYLDSYEEGHWIAAKRILRYLKGTTNFGLWFDGMYDGKPKDLVGFVDSDWAGDKSDRKSTTGWMMRIGNATVTWKSQKQNSVALSTAEAEYIAAASATQEVMWMKQVLKDCGIKMGTVILKEDNQSCIALTKNPVKQTRTKHIDIRYHYIRDLVEQREIMLEYVDTKENMADLFTKPLTKEQGNVLKEMMGVRPYPTSGSDRVRVDGVGQLV